MKRIVPVIVVLFMALLCPSHVAAQVVAKIVEEKFTSSVPDVDNNNRIYASVSYTIKVDGAEGHTLRVEIPWKDAQGKQVYTSIDNNELAMASESYTLESSTDTISGWCGSYHDALCLKPGLHKLNGTIRIFDETSGQYITLNGAKKHIISVTSTKKAPGAKITSCFIEHNQYRNNSKGMYVKFEFELNWMKGQEIKYDISLYRSNGAVMYQKSGKPEKITSTRIPGYTFTNYSDMWGFFPYAGMKLPSGAWNCYALVRLYDVKTGRLLATSNKIDFQMTRR